MKDFEAFKEARLKVDPSTRRNTKYQWEKAYEAYRSSRERVGRAHAGRGQAGSHSKSRSSHSGNQSDYVSEGPNSAGAKVSVSESAYLQKRKILLATVAVAVTASLFKAFSGSAFSSDWGSNWGLAQLIWELSIIFLLKMGVTAVFDVADIHLAQTGEKSQGERPESELDAEQSELNIPEQ